MSKKASWIFLFAAVLLSYPAEAQTSATAQTKSSTSTSAQAQAGKANVNAKADASADARAASSQQEGKQQGKGTKSEMKGSARGSSQSSATATSGDKSLDLSNGTTLEATLTKPLDVKKNKPGDEVVARVTKDVKSDGRVVLRKGSTLIGHVTEAKARGKGESQSVLGLAFDRAVTKDGHEIPVNLAIQAVAASQSTLSAAAGDDGVMGSAGSAGSLTGSAGGVAPPARSGGGLLGGVGSTVSGATNAVGSVAGTAGSTAGATVDSTTHAAGSAGGLNALGNLTSQSQGVIGLQGLNLASEASHATEGGATLVSSSRNVHLDSGTRMVLRAVGTTAAKPQQ